MKLYGKRFFRNELDARISDRKESRDAICWDVDPANRYCRVRVAGSTALVRAWYPVNFFTTPNWLKPGVAVRVAHVGGNKSRIEVVGPGLVLPAPTLPTIATGPDSVLSGMYLTPAGMSLQISAGTFRVSGVTYTFAPTGTAMDAPNWHMGDGGDMSGSYYMAGIDSIAAGSFFRYDAFVIGADGVIDYLKGTTYEWTGITGDTTGPVKPDVPAGHALIRDYVLVHSGMTAIEAHDVGAKWTAPRPAQMTTLTTYADGSTSADSDSGVMWGGADVHDPIVPGQPRRGATLADMSASASISIIDQYGNPYTWWNSGEMNQIEIRMVGNPTNGNYGNASVSGEGAIPNPGAGTMITSLGLGYQKSIQYQRGNASHDQPDNGQAGYPSYYQGTTDSLSAYMLVTLLSDTGYNVGTMVSFNVMDSSGAKMG